MITATTLAAAAAESTENIIKFPRLNLHFDVDSVAFTVFGRDIAWYGVIITFGMILAMIFGLSQMKKFGVDPDKGIDCVIAGIFGGIIGARLYYVLMEIENYKTFKDVIDIRSGGLAIYGGIIGALLFGCITAKIRKIKILPLLDVVGMSFLIGQCIGRWGNFCNHEAFGTITDLPWGMTSEKMVSWAGSHTDLVFTTTEATFHPCFLYESIWTFLGFILLYFVVSKRRKFDGEVFLAYVAWYGLGRAFIEGLRLDSLMIGSMRISQVLAVVSCVVAFILILVMRDKVKKLGTDYVLYCNSDEFKKEMELAAQKIENAKKKGKGKSNDDDDDDIEKDNTEENIEEKADDSLEVDDESCDSALNDNTDDTDNTDDNDEEVVSDNEKNNVEE